MPYKKHLLAQFRGSMGAANAATEEWSCSLRFLIPNVDPALGFSQADVDGMAGAWGAFHLSNAAAIQTTCRLEEVRGYPISAAGIATEEPVISVLTPPVSGSGGATSAHPWQCSMVVSFTASGLGKGKRGRVYLPPNTIGVDTATGGINPTNAANLLNAFGSMLSSIESLRSGAGPRLVIAGKTGAGTIRGVDFIRCGVVQDTQRRRRSSLDEQYVLGNGEYGPSTLTANDYALAG